MRRFILTLLALAATSLIQARMVTLHNKTDEKVYYAFYYQSLKAKIPYSSARLKLKGDYEYIAPHHSQKVHAPDLKAGFQRLGVFVFAKNVPTKEDRDEFFQEKEKKKRFVDIGSVVGMEIHDQYWIDNRDDRIKVYDAYQWKIHQPFKQVAKDYLPDWQDFIPVAGQIRYVGGIISQEVADSMRKKLNKDNPYNDKEALVRVGVTLPPEEIAFNKKRLAYVKKAIEDFTDMTINSDDEIPKIALIASGGGYRAMLCGLGFFAGAENIKLTDMTMWVAGLSGGTWAIGNWYANGKTVDAARDILLPKITKDLTNTAGAERDKIIDAMWLKYVFDEPLTLVDVYGGLLANRFFDHFGADRQKVHLSDQRKLVADGKWPLPIYTAVCPIDTKKKIEFYGKEIYEWFELTPYEVGSVWLGCYVPTWSFGREFDLGKSRDFAPEQSFGFILGTCGSAFAAPFGLLEKEVGLGGFGNFIATQNLPMSHAEVFNFSRGIHKSPIGSSKILKLVDAGLAFNLPYPPVSGEHPERKADIIVVFDSSLTVPSEFIKMEEYASERKLKHPKIDYQHLDKKSIAVFEDEDDSDTPIIVYMPRVNDYPLWNVKKQDPRFKNEYSMYEKVDLDKCTKLECATENFQYTQVQSYNITKATECNVVMNEDVFRDVIKRCIARKQKKQ